MCCVTPLKNFFVLFQYQTCSTAHYQIDLELVGQYSNCNVPSPLALFAVSRSDKMYAKFFHLPYFAKSLSLTRTTILMTRSQRKHNKVLTATCTTEVLLQLLQCGNQGLFRKKLHMRHPTDLLLCPVVVYNKIYFLFRLPNTLAKVNVCVCKHDACTQLR